MIDRLFCCVPSRTGASDGSSRSTSARRPPGFASAAPTSGYGRRISVMRPPTGERERLADAREDAADLRERRADERERATDRLRTALDAQEELAGRRSRVAGQAVTGCGKSSSAALCRAREAVAEGQAGPAEPSCGEAKAHTDARDARAACRRSRSGHLDPSQRGDDDAPARSARTPRIHTDNPAGGRQLSAGALVHGREETGQGQPCRGRLPPSLPGARRVRRRWVAVTGREDGTPARCRASQPGRRAVPRRPKGCLPDALGVGDLIPLRRVVLTRPGMPMAR